MTNIINATIENNDGIIEIHCSNGEEIDIDMIDINGFEIGEGKTYKAKIEVEHSKQTMYEPEELFITLVRLEEAKCIYI